MKEPSTAEISILTSPCQRRRQLSCTKPQQHQFVHAVTIGSMYGISTYIWFILMVNVGKYTLHGSYGICFLPQENLILKIEASSGVIVLPTQTMNAL